MSEIEKEIEPKTLANQLEELSAENQAEPHTEDGAGDAASAVAEVLVSAAELEFETELETELETDETRISEMTAALKRLTDGAELEDSATSFIDGAAGAIDESTAIDLILKSLPENPPQNPMMVGEAEQLPMLGLEEAADEAEEEVPDEPTEFIDNDRLVSVLESLLFATDKPVSIATMKALFKGSNIRTRDIQRSLDLLASSYAASDRGVSLEEIHGGFQLRTKVDNTEYLKRLAKVRPFRLSGPALEVLAIAAYKQPITKTEVDQIRGVESGHLMRALMERGMVGFGEKSDLPGRPMTYVTTRKFLETFGLRNLKELPTLAEIDQLLPEGIGDEEEKETLSSVTDAMSNHIGSSYSEGEDELQDISESLKVIDTTSEFFEQEKVRQRVERDQQKAQDIRDKVAFGDDVEEKDRRWLSRYEAKQEQMAQAAQAGESTGPLIVEDDGVADELAALSAEGSGTAAGSGDDADEMADELSVNPDFDDDDDTGVDDGDHSADRER